MQIHQIAAHLIGAVADALGVMGVRRAQQDHRCVDSPGRQHHNISAEQPNVSTQLRLHGLHLSTVGVHMQPQHLGVVAKGEPLRISSFETEQLGIAARILPIVRPADGDVVGLASLALQSGAKRFQKRFHRLRFGQVVAMAPWLGGVHTGLAMHLVQLFSLFVVRGQFGVVERPCR